MSYRQVATVLALTVTLGACGRGATTGSPAPPSTSATGGGVGVGMTEDEVAAIERQLDDIEKVLDETDAQLRPG